MQSYKRLPLLVVQFGIFLGVLCIVHFDTLRFDYS